MVGLALFKGDSDCGMTSELALSRGDAVLESLAERWQVSKQEKGGEEGGREEKKERGKGKERGGRRGEKGRGRRGGRGGGRGKEEGRKRRGGGEKKEGGEGKGGERGGRGGGSREQGGVPKAIAIHSTPPSLIPLANNYAARTTWLGETTAMERRGFRPMPRDTRPTWAIASGFIQLRPLMSRGVRIVRARAM